MNRSIKIVRNRFGLKGMIGFVALCAVLLGALRFSRDRGPAYLYSGWLFEGNEARRVYAASELGALNEKTSLVVGNLINALLSDRAVAVRVQSARSLGRILSKRGGEPTTAATAAALGHALSDNDPAVRASVADALGQIAPDPAQIVPPLLRAANDGDERVRGAAIAALGLIQRKASVDQKEVRTAIVAAMSDPRLHVRELAIYAFWATAEMSPAFARDLLMDNDVRTRRAAVDALRRSGPLAKTVVRELTLSLNDPDAVVHAGAARAFENSGATDPNVPPAP